MIIVVHRIKASRARPRAVHFNFLLYFVCTVFFLLYFVNEVRFDITVTSIIRDYSPAAAAQGQKRKRTEKIGKG